MWMDRKSFDNGFSVDSCHIQAIKGFADFDAAATLHKNRHSALTGAWLEVWRHQNQIGKIIVSDIRAEQCCEPTTRHASDPGFAIDHPQDATLIWDMLQSDPRSRAILGGNALVF